MAQSRREFVLNTLKGSALLSLSGAVPPFLRSAAAAPAAPAAREKVLVVVQLSGGNDGLNTVIPFKNDLYFRRRPSIAVDPRAVHKLTDDLALHPTMAAMGKLWQQQKLTVIEGVGYPNPSRSHFISMDIWQSARPEKPEKTSGWLGRALAATKDRDAGKLRALSLGSRELPPALVSAGLEVPAVQDLSDFRLQIEGGSSEDRARRKQLLREFAAAPRPVGGPEHLAFVSSAMQTTYAAAEALAEVTARPAARTRYPDTHIARQLRQTAQVIAAGFGTRIFYCSLGGFDTHAKQV